MTSRGYLVLAAFAGLLAITTLLRTNYASNPSWLGIAALFAFVSFALGLGVCERYCEAFNKDLIRRNQLLGQQNQQLCELNIKLLQFYASATSHADDQRGDEPQDSGDID